MNPSQALIQPHKPLSKNLSSRANVSVTIHVFYSHHFQIKERKLPSNFSKFPD